MHLGKANPRHVYTMKSGNTVERVIFAPAIFSRFSENEVFAQCYFRGSRRSRKKNEQQIKHGRGKKKRQRKKRSTRCRLQTLY